MARMFRTVMAWVHLQVGSTAELAAARTEVDALRGELASVKKESEAEKTKLSRCGLTNCLLNSCGLCSPVLCADFLPRLGSCLGLRGRAEAELWRRAPLLLASSVCLPVALVPYLQRMPSLHSTLQHSTC